MSRRQGSLFAEAPARYDAPADFFDAAMAAIRSLAEREAEFTTDDVWDLLTDYRIREPRLLGPVMIHAASVGWIVKTDRSVATRQPQAHCRPIAIWSSRRRGPI